MTGTSQERTKLAMLDVDGTLTHVKSIWQHLMENTGTWEGAGEQNLARFLDKEITYQEFCTLDARLFVGRSYREMQEIAQSVPMRKGADTLLSHLAEQGYRIALISSGLLLLTDYFTTRFEIADCVANDLEVKDGVCTGEAIVHIDDAEKGVFAQQLIARHQPDHVVAIGDSKGDLPMFALADLAIAIAPVDRLVAEATSVQVSGDDLGELCDVL